MTETTYQDRLPLKQGEIADAREARADAMSVAGIRPPQRYEVTPDDHFETAKPRRSPTAFLLKLIERWR